jgi:hypothetical protein
METVVIAVLIIAAVLVVAGAVAAFALSNDKKRRRIREDFGPEYHRTLASTGGDRSKAQKELEERQKRVSKFDLRTLPPELAQHFREQWRRIQERFVDEPKEATSAADRLVQQVMQECGYPMADFEQRTADISVDHPNVVDNYRRAHQISDANDRGQANTEDLRQAFIYYRALFIDLLETEEEPAETAARRERAASKR